MFMENGVILDYDMLEVSSGVSIISRWFCLVDDASWMCPLMTYLPFDVINS